MKKLRVLLLQLFVVSTLISCGNSKIADEAKFNFNFECVTDGKFDKWKAFGTDDYIVSVDSINVHKGKYSALIEYNEGEEVNFKALALEIPSSYEGKEITLTGHIKTENISDGYAGLWMRIDPNIAFDNMKSSGITGTNDWEKYSITLTLDQKNTKQIVIGGMLAGKGKMWLDDLQLTIDGKDIGTLEPVKTLEQEVISEDSGITKISMSQYNKSTLKELGLIWGFLKYYHPNVAKGDYSWDSKLFKIIPQVLNLDNFKKRDSILVSWINGLGDIAPDNNQTKSGGIVKYQPDLNWINNSNYSKELISALTKVRNAKRSGLNHYVELYPNVGNPKFKNEPSYVSRKYPDTGYRVLSLYRYWNIIQYYFPYKNLNDEDWKDVLEKFIPSFVNARNETEYTLTVLEIIAMINDTHANIWGGNQLLESIKGSNIALPIITFVENKAVVTDFYKNENNSTSNLNVGDIILSVNGIKVEDIIKQKLKTTPASNYPTQLRDIANGLLRTNDALINISYNSNGKIKEKNIITYDYITTIKHNMQNSKEALTVFPNNVAYLYPASLKNNEMNTLWQSISKTRGLVIDLRCYPADFIVFSLGSKLLPQSTPFVKFSTGSINTPGLFTSGNNLHIGEKNSDYYKGKVIILINEQTQSQAEYTTMALRIAPNAVVIGSTTAGADGNISYIMLPGGIRTAISGIGVYYPNGDETQRIGIIPDIEIKPTIKGIKNGSDELLEKAFELIS